MSIPGDLLKEGIIKRLQEYEAYIDDELPDYILVMIANKKTVDQIKSDLKLFLGDNANRFIEWLQNVLDNPSLLKATDQSSEGTPYPSSPSSTHSQSPQRHSGKRKKTSHSPIRSKRSKSPKQRRDDSEEDISKRGVQKIKLPPDPKDKRRKVDMSDTPWKTKDQDLRSLIRRRKAETYSDEDDNEGVSVGVSSVVQLPEKKERPKRSGGTGRLLQKAISDIHGITSKSIKRKRNESANRKEKDNTLEESQSEVLELHIQQPDGFKDENVTEDTNGGITETKDEPEVKRKKSIKERLDPLSEEDDQLELTKVERATLAAVRKVLPPKQIDLRQILKNRKEKSAIGKPLESTTRFIVTLDTNNEDIAKVQVSSSSRDDDEIPNNKGLTERCKFWPNCKNGESCSYHHPSVPCRLFPKCKYGQKCCFVHPLCKYDGRCTNPACHYLHSVSKQATPKVQPKVSLPIGAPFSSMPQFSYGYASQHRSRNKFPTKSALSWTPGKSLSGRQFAVPDSQSSNVQV